MNISKFESSGIKIESLLNFYLDPDNIIQDNINIITDPQRSINYDKIFNLPGEYELAGILIKGFPGERYSFFIKERISLFYFLVEPPKKVIQEIEDKFTGVDCIIAAKVKDPVVFLNRLKPHVFITLEEIKKISGFNFQQTRVVKINPKNLIKTSYYLK